MKQTYQDVGEESFTEFGTQYPAPQPLEHLGEHRISVQLWWCSGICEISVYIHTGEDWLVITG